MNTRNRDNRPDLDKGWIFSRPPSALWALRVVRNTTNNSPWLRAIPLIVEDGFEWRDSDHGVPVQRAVDVRERLVRAGRGSPTAGASSASRDRSSARPSRSVPVVDPCSLTGHAEVDEVLGLQGVASVLASDLGLLLFGPWRDVQGLGHEVQSLYLAIGSILASTARM
jgi:hypothetical protein